MSNTLPGMTSTVRALQDGSHDRYRVRFSMDRAAARGRPEWFEVWDRTRWRRIALADTSAIWEMPGLYEQLFGVHLKYRLPILLAAQLDLAVTASGQAMEQLRLLELRAGNGMAGEELREVGVPHVVGIDCDPSARHAARRDRPLAYADYLVGAADNLSRDQAERLAGHRLNGLVAMDSPGGNAMAADELLAGLRCIHEPTWIALGVREARLGGGRAGTFAALINRLVAAGVWEVCRRQNVMLRFTTFNEPIFSQIIIARQRCRPPASAGGGDGA